MVYMKVQRTEGAKALLLTQCTILQAFWEMDKSPVPVIVKAKIFLQARKKKIKEAGGACLLSA
jgi:hypothetical protein